METVQQNGRFTLFSSKFLTIYSILYDWTFYEPLGMFRDSSCLSETYKTVEFELSKSQNLRFK